MNTVFEISIQFKEDLDEKFIIDRLSSVAEDIQVDDIYSNVYNFLVVMEEDTDVAEVEMLALVLTDEFKLGDLLSIDEL